MPLSQVLPPTLAAISLDEGRQQLREPNAAENTLINDQIWAAYGRAELATGRQLVTATWDLELDGFPAERWIELPKPPLVSVTWIKYLNAAGTLVEWPLTGNYTVKAPAGPYCARGRVVLAYGVTWPTPQPQPGCVTVRFVCGYGAPAVVPPLLKAALKLDLATFFEQREGLTGTTMVALPGGVESIYRGFKSWPRQRLPGYNE